MEHQRLKLAPGMHVLRESIQDCGITYELERHRAKLLLTVESSQEEGLRDQVATTLVIYIKKDAAMKLLHDMTKLSDEMTWQP